MFSRRRQRIILRTFPVVLLFLVLFYNVPIVTEKKNFPHVIWMLWDTGWDTAPPLQLTCKSSWQHFNPQYTIKLLDMEQAEKTIQRKNHYTDDAWNNAYIQAKSDIIRVELLAKYGGVWVDATVRCNEPLSFWIDQAFKPAHFFVYERRDADLTEDEIPHISSWFMVTSNTSYIITRLRNEVHKKWLHKPYPPQTYGYYWLHKIFRHLILTDKDFFDEYNKMPFQDAAGPHCLTYERSHMNKMTSPPCENRFKTDILFNNV